jgi:hypothetical protein
MIQYLVRLSLEFISFVLVSLKLQAQSQQIKIINYQSQDHKSIEQRGPDIENCTQTDCFSYVSLEGNIQDYLFAK